MNFILLELRNEEINAKKTITVKVATYIMQLWKENVKNFRFATIADI